MALTMPSNLIIFRDTWRSFIIALIADFNWTTCCLGLLMSLKEHRKRNGSGAVYDDPRVAVGAGRFDEVGARAEA